ncbi:hypothetical protein SERLA73DRAFT_179286 [Serpula lacrymans var. lacrymans S7.3]|uniref:Phosphoglycerate mutase-like protein n=2 Tax=Serpula lacrymans var. lacrymans TaxID=341189 RepID=F8PRU8_SERL3|nr:uncharacterized protein SERLADRAFT_464338 [Serpula lacrymans var. lacrymans S7.9]EGO01183.1 hypothetical protein SERLA73DRAFT_179286 [Serpula lacrymans var. lacrymans S7.3]EGO26831.1 hypothetical protein SERLADRAFT_464338 [Serpula lacrymans var. lacrymans S7.9]
MVNISSTAGLLGVVIIARHGDRLGYYQDPCTYNATQSRITPLGSVQEFELGSFLRLQYLTPESPSFIEGISSDLVDVNQVLVRADSGGENVVLNSAYSLLQGLYPATTESSITLSNGKLVTGPLGGYQYVPVESVDVNEIPSLTSWQLCPYFQTHLNRTYTSTAFLQKAQEAAPFLEAVKPYIGNISNNFTNMWNIFDYVNVQSIHNKTYAEELPPTFAAQAYDYANFHEYNVFTDYVSIGVGEIGVRTLLPSIFSDFGNITEKSNPLKLVLTEVDYQPFISLFNVTNATLTDPDIAGIVDYAAVVALELSENSDGQPSISMKFKNGTNDQDFRQLTMWGNTSVLVEDFVSQLASTTINTTQEWCFSCNQTILRGCSIYNFSTDPFLNPGPPSKPGK